MPRGDKLRFRPLERPFHVVLVEPEDAGAIKVDTVRDDVIPKVEGDGGITSYVGGYTASYADQFPDLVWTSPEQVARTGLDAVVANRTLAVPAP